MDKVQRVGASYLLAFVGATGTAVGAEIVLDVVAHEVDGVGRTSEATTKVAISEPLTASIPTDAPHARAIDRNSSSGGSAATNVDGKGFFNPSPGGGAIGSRRRTIVSHDHANDAEARSVGTEVETGGSRGSTRAKLHCGLLAPNAIRLDTAARLGNDPERTPKHGMETYQKARW